jgi:hypothetical protein
MTATSTVPKFRGPGPTPGFRARLTNNLDLGTFIRARQMFLVASVSTNVNSFGLNGVILVARDGEALEAATYAMENFAIEKGEFVTLPIAKPGTTDETRYGWVSTAGRTFEIPRALPKCPENALAELFPAKR